MTANKKNKKIKNKNVLYIIEIFILVALSAFLSVISAVLPIINLWGLLCVGVSAALFACALFLLNPGVIIISGAISFIAAFTVNGNIVNAFASLAYIIIGAFIYFGVKRKLNRTQITVGIICALSVFYICLIIFGFLSSEGTFSVRMASSAIENNLSGVIKVYTDQYYSALSQYSESAAEAAYLSEAYAAELILNLKALTPSFFILFVSACAYLSTAFFRVAYNIFIPMANPNRKKIKNKYWRVSVSSVSAIIMITAIFFMILLSGHSNPIPRIVLTNFVYILTPGLCVTGIYFIYDKLFKSVSRFITVAIVSCVALFAFIFLMPVATIYVVMTILTVAGLYAALIGDIKKFYEKAKKFMIGDDDDDDWLD